ncbi:MAG: LamG domain-containing protein [Kiritimatiellae bacterium]|nr:LamG domain-containing protein [Kiritimatiellia bacterium]
MAAPRLGETYCYWNFDDGAAGTEANILTNSVYTNPYVDILHGVAGTTSGSGPGGVKPQFTNYLPSSTEMLVRDGVTGAIVNSNSTSLYFRNAGTGATPNFQTGSIVTAADPNIPEFFPTNFTVEAFVKADRAAQWALIIGKRRSNGGDYSWSIGVESDGDFRCRFDTTDPVTTTNHNPNQVFRSYQPIYDGSWHHVAMSYHYPTKTCKLYIDYELKRTATTTYPMYIDTGVIQIGGGDRNFDGWIDEMRITKRVLAPTEFLYLERPPAPLGTVILIR